MNESDARGLIGKTVTIRNWHRDPFTKKRWSGDNVGSVIRVEPGKIVLRGTVKMLGTYPEIHISLDRVEEWR